VRSFYAIFTSQAGSVGDGRNTAGLAGGKGPMRRSQVDVGRSRKQSFSVAGVAERSERRKS